MSRSRTQRTAAGVRTVYLCIQNRHSSQLTNMLFMVNRAFLSQRSIIPSIAMCRIWMFSRFNSYYQLYVSPVMYLRYGRWATCHGNDRDTEHKQAQWHFKGMKGGLLDTEHKQAQWHFKGMKGGQLAMKTIGRRT